MWCELQFSDSKSDPVILLATRDPAGAATFWRPATLAAAGLLRSAMSATVRAGQGQARAVPVRPAAAGLFLPVSERPLSKPLDSECLPTLSRVEGAGTAQGAGAHRIQAGQKDTYE